MGNCWDIVIDKMNSETLETPPIDNIPSNEIKNNKLTEINIDSSLYKLILERKRAKLRF